MKKIGITQRVESVAHYLERRDCLDQRWADFSTLLGFIPIPLPNITAENVRDLIDTLDLDAIILSGGNSLSILGDAADTAPERDSFETALVDIAIEKGIPILAVCRGMQLLNCHFEGKLTPVKGHVAKDHVIISCDKTAILPHTVNSYHSWGITPAGLGKHLMPLATDDQGNIEAFKHMTYRILAIMWHPERVTGFDLTDIEFIKTHLLWN